MNTGRWCVDKAQAGVDYRCSSTRNVVRTIRLTIGSPIKKRPRVGLATWRHMFMTSHSSNAVPCYDCGSQVRQRPILGWFERPEIRSFEFDAD